MPVVMDKPQAIVIGSKVYVGGGATENAGDRKQVFQYDLSHDEWSRLPSHQVRLFPMAQFMGHLITVGGLMQASVITDKVYRFKEQSQKWEEFIKPMPTARFRPSVATTQSAIVASGGFTGVRNDKLMPCATVEVYSSDTAQWHTADPLPVPCGAMTSVTIADTWYQLGGGGTDEKDLTTILCAPLTALIQKATSPAPQSASPMSVWKTLPDTPLKWSTAASMSGSLIAVGGWNVGTPPSSAVYIFFPLTNSWVRATTGELPEPRKSSTAVQVSSNQVLVVGGKDKQIKRTKTVFLGSITI